MVFEGIALIAVVGKIKENGGDVTHGKSLYKIKGL